MNTLEKLEEIRKYATLHAILFRHAGVALQFSEAREMNSQNPNGLVVHAYYETLELAVYREYARLVSNAVIPATAGVSA